MLRVGVRALRGAEAPLFHGTPRVLLVLCKIKIKVKGVGQECPTHTVLSPLRGSLICRFPTHGLRRGLYSCSAAEIRNCLYAALRRRSSTVLHTSCPSSVKSRSKS